MTGCYKEDGLDASKPGETVTLPDAAYTISGSVTDIETGDGVNLTAVETNVGTATILGDGSYAVKISKFTESEKVVNLIFKAEGYKDAKRTVSVAKIRWANCSISSVGCYEKGYSCKRICRRCI